VKEAEREKDEIEILLVAKIWNGRGSLDPVNVAGAIESSTL
jgi:hypothetical protein